MFFRPKPEIRKQLAELETGDKDGLNGILDKITIEDYETFFTGKSTADFNDKNVQRELMGDFDNVILILIWMNQIWRSYSTSIIY